MLEPGPLHAWVRAAHATTDWTTSVCTGSLILGAAGVLDGLEATTHWNAMDELAGLGVTAIDDRRVVAQGKVVTAAGVSSGIDMALWLAAQIAGDDIAKAIQLGIEYDPQPPFDSGSVAKADPELVAFLRLLIGRRRRAGRRGRRRHLIPGRPGGRATRRSGLAGRAGPGEAGVGRVDRPRRRRRPTCRRTPRRPAAAGGPGRGDPRARRA